MPAGSLRDPNQRALLLQLAMQEQATNPTNGQPRVVGRPQSALALNAYVDAMPSAGEKDTDFQRQRTADLQAQDEEELARNKARLSDHYEAAKADAAVRGFETRRNVAEELPTKVVKGVRGDMRGEVGRTVSAEPRTIKGVRRITDQGGSFTDPDAAMTLEQRNRIAPSVLAAGINNDSREEIAKMNADSREAVAGVKTELQQQQARTAQQSAQTTRDEVNRLAQELHDDPYLASNIGPVDARLPTVRAGSVDFQKRVERLKSLLSLESRSKLKGQGAISDKETQMLSNSVTSLAGATDEAIFKKELQRIIQATTGAAGGGAIGQGGAGEFDYVNGQLVPRK